MTDHSDAPKDYHDLALSFIQRGWIGEPIHLVEMPSGGVTSIDNARLAVARDLNMELNAVVHRYAERLPSEVLRSRFTDPWHETPRSWGDLVTNRIDNQSPDWAARNPEGSMERPNSDD